jgi:hypothetical protein
MDHRDTMSQRHAGTISAAGVRELAKESDVRDEQL